MGVRTVFEQVALAGVGLNYCFTCFLYFLYLLKSVCGGFGFASQRVLTVGEERVQRTTSLLFFLHFNF